MEQARAYEWFVEKGLEYARHDGVSLRGDLYRPRGEGPFPVLVAVHGGGWQSGSPESYRHWGPWLAERGFALFSIAYRLSSPGRGSCPQAVWDVRAAVQFLRWQAQERGFDPERIGMMGGSAGGHLTSLVALAGEEAPFANAYPDDPYAHVSSKVRAVVPFYGVFDLQAQWMHDLVHRTYDNIAENFMGAPPTENRRVYIEASPMTWAERPRNKVSFLLITGTEDEIVDRSQTDAFLVALKQANFYVRRIVVQGAGHFFEQDPIEEPGSRPAQVAGPILRFLQERL
jgi:acetyl esterase/lipase